MHDSSQVTSIHTTTQNDRTSLDAHITRTISLTLFLCHIHIRCLNEKKNPKRTRLKTNFFLCKERIYMSIYIYIHVQIYRSTINYKCRARHTFMMSVIHNIIESVLFYFLPLAIEDEALPSVVSDTLAIIRPLATTSSNLS